jgi:hypothetical protein
VLLAMVDADYKFVYIDVGAQGHFSDAGIFDRSRLNYLIKNDRLNIPKDLSLLGMPTNDCRSLHVILVDEGMHDRSTY